MSLEENSVLEKIPKDLCVLIILVIWLTVNLNLLPIKYTHFSSTGEGFKDSRIRHLRKIHSPLLPSSLINFYFLVTEMFHFTIFLGYFITLLGSCVKIISLTLYFPSLRSAWSSYWLVYYAIPYKLWLLYHIKNFSL